MNYNDSKDVAAIFEKEWKYKYVLMMVYYIN